MDINKTRQQMQNLRNKINNPQKPISINNGIIKFEKNAPVKTQPIIQKPASVVISEKLQKARQILEQRKELLERKGISHRLISLSPLNDANKTKPKPQPQKNSNPPPPPKPGCSSCSRKKK